MRASLFARLFRIGEKIGTAWDSPTTPVNAVASSLTTNLTGHTNNDLVFTAVTKGVAGDDITIRYVDPGKDAEAIVVTVVGKAITFTLAYGEGAITSTGDDVKAALLASAAASALVTAADKAANDGSGLVEAMAATPLAGGVDGTVGTMGEIRFDGSYLYLCLAANTIADANWRRVSLGSAY